MRERRSAFRAVVAKRAAVAFAVSAVSATGLAVSTPSVSAAAIFTVTTTADSPEGQPTPPESLRAAVEFARASSTSTTIVFELPAGDDEIALTRSLPAFNRPATVEGPGSSELTISIPDRRIFFSRHDLAITGLTLTGGAAQDGGAIWSGDADGAPSHVEIDDVAFVANRALVAGGAIYKESGTLVVRNSHFESNESSDVGSAVFAGPVGEPTDVTIENTTITSNTIVTTKPGAALDHRAGSIVVETSRIDDNVGYGGAGLRVTGTTTVRDTVISGNQSFGAGGGISNFGDLTLERVTLDGNVASSDADAPQLRHESLSLTIEDSTLIGSGPGSTVLVAGKTFSPITIVNSTISGGAAEFTETFGGTVSIRHVTLIDAPIHVATTTSAPDLQLPTVDVDHSILAQLDATVEPLASGVVSRVDASLIEDSTLISFTSGTDNVEDAASLLGPLDDNGGPTRTHRPSAGSPAINAGTATVASAPGADQRGEQRILGGAIDIGSVEIGTYGPESFIVTSTEDAGVGTLRSAIFASEATPGIDTITFDLPAGPQRIHLLSPLKTVTDPVVIVGPGADVLEVTIEALHILRATGDLTISGMTLIGGSAVRGGGIWADGANLTVDDMIFSGHRSIDAGAAIAADGAQLTIANSEFRDNLTFNIGAAVAAGTDSSSTDVTIVDSIFESNNTVPGRVGLAIDVVNGGLEMSGSLVAENAGATAGSGIRTGGPTRITDTTIFSNWADIGPGGIVSNGSLVLDRVALSPSPAGGEDNADTIWHRGGTIELVDSTVTGTSDFANAVVMLDTDDSIGVVNSTLVGADVHLPEGFNGSATIAHSTLLDSRPVSDPTAAGGLALAGVTVDHTIVASTVGAVPGPTVGQVTNSLIQFPTLMTPTTGSANIVDRDPLLGPLTDNGGPTATLMPAFNSPVVNAGDPGFVGVATDQRGVDRVQRGRVDIGAVETSLDPFEPRLFQPIDPARFADSRPSGVTIDGAERGWGPATTRPIAIAGRGDVPPSATGVIVNVTAVRPQANGFLSIVPCDVGTPTTASLNFQAGVTLSSEIVAPIGGDGFLCMFSSVPTDLVLDVVGYTDALSGIKSATPRRFEDTRAGSVADIAGRSPSGRLAVGGTLRFAAAGRGQVPADAQAVVVNVTAIRPAGRGYVTSHPCLDTPPLTASLNYEAGITRGNEVIVALDENGDACFTSSESTDLSVDVVGWIEANADYTAAAPQRLMDTRTNGATVDGDFVGDGRIGAGQEIEFQISGRGSIAATASLATINVTAVNPTSTGFLTVRTCGSGAPSVANLTYRVGVTGGNEIMTRLGPSGSICIFSSADTHVTVDVVGFG